MLQKNRNNDENTLLEFGYAGIGAQGATVFLPVHRRFKEKEGTGMSRRSVIHMEAAIDYIESHLVAILPSVLYSLLRYRRRQNE